MFFTASALRQIYKDGKLDNILKEGKALAKFDHHHIVKYNSCWVEWYPAGTIDESDDDEEG